MSDASARRRSPEFWRRFFLMLANGVFDKRPCYCAETSTRNCPRHAP